MIIIYMVLTGLVTRCTLQRNMAKNGKLLTILEGKFTYSTTQTTVQYTTQIITRKNILLNKNRTRNIFNLVDKILR